MYLGLGKSRHKLFQIFYLHINSKTKHDLLKKIELAVATKSAREIRIVDTDRILNPECLEVPMWF